MHRIKKEWCAAVSIKLNQVSKRTEGIEKLTLDSFHRSCFLVFSFLDVLYWVLVIMVSGWQGYYLLLKQNFQCEFSQVWAEIHYKWICHYRLFNCFSTLTWPVTQSTQLLVIQTKALMDTWQCWWSKNAQTCFLCYLQHRLTPWSGNMANDLHLYLQRNWNQNAFAQLWVWYSQCTNMAMVSMSSGPLEQRTWTHIYLCRAISWKYWRRCEEGRGERGWGSSQRLVCFVVEPFSSSYISQSGCVSSDIQKCFISPKVKKSQRHLNEPEVLKEKHMEWIAKILQNIFCAVTLSWHHGYCVPFPRWKVILNQERYRWQERRRPEKIPNLKEGCKHYQLHRSRTKGSMWKSQWERAQKLAEKTPVPSRTKEFDRRHLTLTYFSGQIWPVLILTAQ